MHLIQDYVFSMHVLISIFLVVAYMSLLPIYYALLTRYIVRLCCFQVVDADHSFKMLVY